MSPAEREPERDCAGLTLQQLQITDPSRQRGRPVMTNPQMSK